MAAGLDRPLDGFRVVEFGHLVAGPLATMYLADLGADVVKVEPPTGDTIRNQGTVFVAGESPAFFSVNRNKQSVVLDLRQPAGVVAARRLIDRADVVIENYRPGVLDRLGLGYPVLRETNPGLVHCSVSGFGLTGPYRDRPAVDPILQSMAGLMSITGEPGQPPVLIGSPIIDLYAGALAAQGVLAALLARSRTGQGQHLETSLLNAGLYLLAPRDGPYLATGQVPQPAGRAHRQMAPYQAFQTADGYFFLCIRTDADWRRLGEAIGATELLADPRFATNAGRVKHRAALLAQLEPILAGYSTAELGALTDQLGLVAGPVQRMDQVFADPQVLHNEMVVGLAHPTAGSIRVLGLPIKFDATPGRIETPPPLLGEHTDRVLAELGYPAHEIAELRASGVTVARGRAPG